MSWIAVAVGGGSAIAGIVQTNANRQRQKGIIGKAYDTAQARMSISQTDTREQVGESAGQRGLTQTGSVTLGNPVGPGATPGVGGAHDLGGQQTLDLAREQTIEQSGLKNESAADLSNVNEEANQGMIGAAAGGVQTGFGVEGAMNEAAAMRTGAPGALAAIGNYSGEASPYPNSFGGIDPVNPLGRGAWSTPAAGGSTGAAKGAATTADFHVNG